MDVEVKRLRRNARKHAIAAGEWARKASEHRKNRHDRHKKIDDVKVESTKARKSCGDRSTKFLKESRGSQVTCYSRRARITSCDGILRSFTLSGGLELRSSRAEGLALQQTCSS